MKWFRVATQGATTDGRTITREWIEQMASTYNPAKYGARVWMEHMRSLYSDGAFPALGDVTAVKAEEVEDGNLALFVQIDPTDKLKEINAARQKIYTSIEVDPDFAGSGQAYLSGLAITDSPASLGTSMLQFSAQQGVDNPLNSRKQRPENLFTAALETTLDFSEAPEADKPSLFDQVKGLFTKHREAGKAEFGTFRTDLEKTLELFVKDNTELRAELDKRPSADQFSQLQTEHAELKGKFDALYSRLDNEPDVHHHRSRATGSAEGLVTDC